MRLRLGTRSGALPVRKHHTFLPGVLAAALGLAGVAGWAGAQQPGSMPTPGMPGSVVPVPGGSTAAAPAPAGQPTTAAPEKTVTVNFVNAPWDTVLDWFATESALTPIYTVKPTGSVTIKPPANRKFTMAEVVDLLNEAMTKDKFILIRRQVTFTIVPADEKLDTSIVPRIELSELPKRGKTELVQVLIPLMSLAVEETAPEVQKMLTPFGQVSMLTKTNTLVIVDTAGNINRIYQTIQEVERKSGEGDTLTYHCQYKKAQDVADTLKTLLADRTSDVTVSGGAGAPPQQYYGQGGQQYYGQGGQQYYQGQGYDPRQGGGPGRRDGNTGGGPAGRVKSVAITVDAKANAITIAAPPEKIQLARKLIEDIDKPPYPGATKIKVTDPELRKYSVPPGTADAVVKTLTAAQPSLRIVALPASNEVMVFATPEEHLDVAKLLRLDPGTSARTTATIQLAFTPPDEMATKLTKVFPSTAGGPTIEANVAGQQSIIVTGTPAQIKEVQDAVEVIEGTKVQGGTGINPLKRTITLPNASPSIVAEHLARMFQEMGMNPVIVQDPNAPPKIIKPTLQLPPGTSGSLNPLAPAGQPAPAPAPKTPVLPPGMLPGAMPQYSPENPQSSADRPEAPSRLSGGGRFASTRLISASQVVDPATKSDKKPILIQVTGNQLIITSEDTGALDTIATLARFYISDRPQDNLFKVIRLKNVSAEDAANELTEIFNGPQQQQQRGGRGGGGLFGGGGGGLGALGALFGGGGGAPAAPAGTNPNRIRVVAEKISNSLIVIKASPSDLLTMESLLQRYIDSGATDDAVALKTWIVHVQNASASSMASVVRDVYRSAMQTTPTGGGGPQIGGFPFATFGGGGQGQTQASKPPALSVTTDDRSNSVILYCNEGMAKEIAFLVETLDNQTVATTDVTKVVPLAGVDPNLVQQAIYAIQGINPQQGMRGGLGGGGLGGGGFGGLGGGGFGGGGFPGGGGGLGGGGFGGLGGGGFGGLGGGAMGRPGGGFGGGGLGGGGFGGGGARPIGGGGGGGARGGGGRPGGGGLQSFNGGTEGPVNFDYRGMEAPSAQAGDSGTSGSLYDPMLDPKWAGVSNDTTSPVQHQYGAGGPPAPQTPHGVVQTGGGQPGETPPYPMRPPTQPGPQVNPPTAPPGAQAPRAPVYAYPLEGAGALIIRAGSAADLQLILDLIEYLKELSRTAKPRLEIIPMEHQDCNYVANFMTTLFSRVIVAGPQGNYLAQPTGTTGFGGLGGLGGGLGGLGGLGGQQQIINRGVYFLAIPQLNAVFVAGPEGRFADIIREIRKIDVPNSDAVHPRPYRLKRASAQIIAQQIVQFWNARFPGNSLQVNQFRVTYDSNSNTVWVQASKADHEELEALIRDWDNSDSQSVHEVRVFLLRNAIATELAQVISSALTDNLVNPLAQATAYPGPVATAAGGTAGITTTPGGGVGLGAAAGALGGALGGGAAGALGGAIGGALGGGAAGGGLGGGALGGGALGGAGATTNIQTIIPTVGVGIGGGLVTKTNTLRFFSPSDQQVYQSGVLADVHLVPNARINAIIVTAPEQTMKLIEKLIENMDRVAAAAAFVQVFELKRTDAALIAAMLRQLFSSTTTGGLGGGALGGAGGGLGGAGGVGSAVQRPALVLPGLDIAPGATLIDLRISVDDRTNSLIVAGSQNDLETIRAIIFKLETSAAQDRLSEVYKLRNAAAADVATTLTTYITNSFTNIYSAATAQTGTSFLTAYQQLQRSVVVVAEPVSNTLLISATPYWFNEMKRVIERMDAQPPQVVIQVMIANVQLNNAEEFGVEFGIQSPVLFARGSLATPTTTNGVTNAAVPGFNFNTTAPLGNSSLAQAGTVGFQGLQNLGVGRTSTTGQGFGGFIFSAASDTFNLLIRALKAQNRIDILSAPQVQVMDNQAGFIQVGANYPYLTTSSVTGTGVATQSIAYEPIGVTMRVTPRVNPDGKVLMRVEPTISSVAAAPVSLGNGITVPQFNVQTVQTTVLASDGETIVLGGLITKQDTRIENGYPFFKDIPYVGALFRYRSHQIQRNEVLVIMTPHIIRSEADQARILAEESAKMHWCVPDLARIYGHGMEVIEPAMQGARAMPLNPGPTNGLAVPAPPPPAQGYGPGTPPPAVVPAIPPSTTGTYVPGSNGYYVPGPAYFDTTPVTTGTPGMTAQPPIVNPGAGQPIQSTPLPPATAPGAGTPPGVPVPPGTPSMPPGITGAAQPLPTLPVTPAVAAQPAPAPVAAAPYRMTMPNGQVVPTPAVPAGPAPLPPTAARGYVMVMPPQQQQQQQPAGNGGLPPSGSDSPATSDKPKTREGRPWDVFGR